MSQPHFEGSQGQPLSQETSMYGTKRKRSSSGRSLATGAHSSSRTYGRSTVGNYTGNYSSSRSYSRKKLDSVFPKGTVRLPLGSLPPCMIVPHRYAAQLIVPVGASTFTPQQYRLNSVFDPDLTGAGHQPYLRDTMAGLYNVYCVYGTRLELEATTSDTAGSFAFSMAPTPDSAAPGNISLMAERSGNHWALTYDKPVKVKRWFDIGAVLGQSKQTIMHDDVFSAASGGNPGVQAYLNLGVQNYNAAASTINITLVLTYYTKWWSRQPQGQS